MAMTKHELAAVLESLRHVTWLQPIRVFGCGVVSARLPATDRVTVVAAGNLLSGPFVCATSQAVHWFGRLRSEV
jgi:chlorophyll/bacteriochlorophyll a synthase